MQTRIRKGFRAELSYTSPVVSLLCIASHCTVRHRLPKVHWSRLQQVPIVSRQQQAMLMLTIFWQKDVQCAIPGIQHTLQIN